MLACNYIRMDMLKFLMHKFKFLLQYYVYFGGERYVDLGLGTHRVKCRVHKNFRYTTIFSS